MAFKLTKDERKERDEYVAELELASKAVEDAVIAYNDLLRPAHAAVKEALDEYNGILEKVQDFTRGVADRIEDEFSEKSEQFQESSKGEVVSAWHEAWDCIDLEVVELDDFEEMGIELSHRELLEELTDNPGGN